MYISVELTPIEPYLNGLTALRIERGSTVSDVFGLLGIDPPADLEIGVWGRKIMPDHVLDNGERIEFYRPLRCDPKAARRARATRRRR